MDNFDLQVEQDSQAVEYQTISSGCSIDKIDRPDRLHEWLKPNEIEHLHNYFKEKKQLNYTQLRDVLLSLNITFTDIEYNRLFLKINQNHDFKCDWNEFISYLIFGFQEDDPAGQKELLILPIAETPEVRKSEHKSAVCCISLIKKSSGDNIDDDAKRNIEDDDGEVDEAAEQKKKMEDLLAGESADVMGIWLTGSKEGQVRFWSPTLDLLRGGLSESIHLKMSTWILCIQALSDVSVVCTSSTERELRFHEIVASSFVLRIVIRSMPFAVCCMAYSFGPKSHSRLILGDFGGNIRILEYDPYLRGPFQSKPGAALIEVFWTDILKGKLPLFIVHEYNNVHMEHIQKVFYSLRMNSLFSSAEYRNTKKYRGRCPGLIVNNGDDKTVFRIPLGVTTFFVDDKNNLVLTGGPDTFVRVWDVYIPSEPSGILTGHNGGIVMVFVQSEEKMAYSVDYQKIIKVWDVTEFVLLQTFGDLVRILSGETDLVYYYNISLRTLMVGGRKLVTVKCNPRIRVDLTDGNTHAAPVSVVLYNRLFRNVVTCGLDSYIIVWDPWTGRRKIIMKNCHTKQVYGEHIDIEITAACFDPLEQFLLTGARDGSLKIWNYNNAVCIRNMSIKPEHEVTSVIWVIERILAVGWDKQVTEFNDAEGSEYSDPKKWPKFHTDDITCADVKLGEGVVTATYSGELIFWRLETGQPYRRYSVSTPDEFIELKHFRDIDDNAQMKSKGPNSSQHFSISHFVRKSVSVRIRDIEKTQNRRGSFTGKRLQSADETEEAMLQMYNNRKQALPMSVQAVLFLQTRPMTTEHGSVLVALETGVIQVFSHHQRGGYITEFIAIHKTGDCVLTMATDRHNRYLFTGTAFGYIKTWYIENYGIPERDKVKVCMPLLRLQFIFLRNELFMPRAKRAIRHQKEPLLVSSHKGHLRAITSIVFINLPKILITGSYDCSCRLWSLGGRYLGTLGTPLPWMKLSPFEPVEEEVTQYRIPPDIQKVASSTTMKIISGHIQDRFRVTVPKLATNEENEDPEEGDGLYTKPLRDPILGKHFGLPGLSAAEQRISLDTNASYTPVFTHLKIHDASDLVKPPTPPVIRRVANENYMDFYEPTIKKEPAKDRLEMMKPRKRSGHKGLVAFSMDPEKKEEGEE